MTFRLNPRHPYAHAPRLPDGDGPVEIASLFEGGTISGPMEIEIGPGRGRFLIERCAAAPTVSILGLEIRLKWATLVDARLKKDGLHGRARVLGEDAKAALPRLRPDGVVSRVYLHFPDPWWKKRHEKRLVMASSLLDEVARLLRPGGELFVQTDVEERAELYERQIAEHPLFVPAGEAEGSARIGDHTFGARTNREYRAIEDGLPVHRMLYRRAPAGDTVVAP